ncbi:hypothetical protein [Nocardia huaxiensis]|uniref:hypothetical protein n=1 Tax=Nocardia huaxiensis TaxID=2755382 RepID=UPI001E3D3F03|nr:hypothetical protein [Nocardia huaxiensis]UFS97244.1 hypothetical protein LPY97_04775 [Nocardia huaxiensis]
MASTVLRRGFLGAACALAAIMQFAPSATAGIVGVIVYNTGSEGPVMGCPQTIKAGVSNPVEGDFSITVDGTPLPGVSYNPTDGAHTLWTPTRLGWHTIEVHQHTPDGTTHTGRLDIDVRRTGINAGSSCLVNGLPLPIDPRTGSLFT